MIFELFRIQILSNVTAVLILELKLIASFSAFFATHDSLGYLVYKLIVLGSENKFCL